MADRFAFSARFRDVLAGMHRHEREQFLRTVEKFTNNPGLPGLRLEKLQGHETLWSIRASLSDRIILERSEDEAGVIWTFGNAGPHDDYRKLRR